MRLIGEKGVSYKRLNFMAGCLAQRSWDADAIPLTQPVMLKEIALLDPETGIKSPALEVLVDNDIDWGRKGILPEGTLLGLLEPEISR